MKMQFNMAAIEREIQRGVDDLVRKQSRDLERLGNQYKGKPVATIKPALQRLFAGYGGSITDPELTEWAQMISDGTRITLKSGRIR